MVAGLIPMAAAQALAIGAPEVDGRGVFMILLVAGPLLFAAAQAGYLWAALGIFPKRQLWACAAVSMIGLAASWLDRRVGLLLMTECLVVVATIDRARSDVMTESTADASL